MLVLSRKVGQRIVLPQCGITITVLGIQGNRVRVGIDAPASIDVFREEVLDDFDPALKDLVRRTSQPMAQNIAERVLRMKTAREIREYLTREVQAIWPDAALLDARA